MSQYKNYQQANNRPPKPDNWLVWAILVTMCCCLPLGIVGIVFAAKADEHYSAGRYAEAYASARNAKNWTLVGLACGVVYIVFLIAFYLLTTVATLLPLGLYWDLF